MLKQQTHYMTSIAWKIGNFEVINLTMNKKYSVKFVVNQSSLDLLCDPLFFMKRYCDSKLQCVHLGSVHKYFGAGAGQNGGGVKKVLSYQKGGGPKSFP